jgi:hypothetical protein
MDTPFHELRENLRREVADRLYYLLRGINTHGLTEELIELIEANIDAAYAATQPNNATK